MKNNDERSLNWCPRLRMECGLVADPSDCVLLDTADLLCTRHCRPREPTDEEEVIRYVKGRLNKGLEQYGTLDITEDNRDYVHEALEEALDMAVYLACQLIKIKRLKKS